MQAGNLTQAERLAGELRAIRAEYRLTQKGLAALSGVSLTTIKAIERSEQISKPETLRLLARGAATDGAGRLDEQRSEDYYRRLMRASGYSADTSSPDESSEPEPVGRLDREIRETFSDDAQMIEDFFIQARDFNDEDRRFVLSTIRWLNHTIPVATARRKTRALLASR